METVLGQLITVPGVVGGMVYDRSGVLLSRTFPPLFDAGALADAARILADATAGMEKITGAVGTLDMRFADARLVVRPMEGASLVLLCAAQTNLQLLNISTSVAIPKLERLVATLPGPGEDAGAPPADDAGDPPA